MAKKKNELTTTSVKVPSTKVRQPSTRKYDDTIWVDAEVVEKKQPKARAKKSYAFNKFASTLVLTLTLLASLVIVLWLWFFVFNERPTTNFTAQISTIGTTSEQLALEFNQLRGNVGSGEALNEMKITAYTDENLTTTFASGIQTLGKVNFKHQNIAPDIFSTKAVYEREFNKTTFKYYNEDANNHTFVASDKLDHDDYFIIEIDNKIYKLNFSDKQVKVGRFLWMKQYNQSSPIAMFECMINSVNSLEVGDYVVDMPLTEYFNISEYNEETKQFNRLDVESQNKIRFEVKVHIEDRGVVNHVQSLFDSVIGNPDFNIDGIEEKNYWKATPVLTLTNSDFENNNGYLSLNKDLIAYVNAYSNLEVQVDINVDSTIKGFNYYAFYGIPLKQLTLTSTQSTTFEILNLALKDTGIDVEDIVLNNVVISEVTHG